MVSSKPNATIPGGFGKVLNAIEGLQQRLGSFSTDDIGEAAEKARTLALRLAALQQRLGTLTEIRESIAAVRMAAERAANEASELVESEAAGRPLPLQAIVQASNLIRFPRLPKGAKDRASFAAPIETGAAASPEIFTQATTPVLANHDPVLEADFQPAPTDQTSGTETIAPATEQTMPSVNRKAADSPSIDGQEAEPLEPPPVSTEEPQPNFAETAQSHTVEADGSGAQANTDPSPAPQPMGAPQSKSATLKETTTSKFDQHLLDDLIKNYGEFAASPNLPVPADPAMARNSDEEAEPKPRADFPSLRKQGELDRQLKKLIKDYGEYDLYSRQSPINLKTGVLAAFLLLGVIFSGFYFFYAPHSASLPRRGSTSQSIAGSSDATGSTATAGANQGQVRAGENKQARGLHETLEAGETREASDNSPIKQNP